MGKIPAGKPTKEEERAVQDTNRKLFYCKVCGYVTLREEAPHMCPICRAKQEMFGEIILGSPIQVR